MIVTIKNKKIVKIHIDSSPGETTSFFNRAKTLTDLMIRQQSTDVDAVSGNLQFQRNYRCSEKCVVWNKIDNETGACIFRGKRQGEKGRKGYRNRQLFSACSAARRMFCMWKMCRTVSEKKCRTTVSGKILEKQIVKMYNKVQLLYYRRRG